MAGSPAPSPWLLTLKPRPAATRRLFCFPHAGGGGSLFRTWPDGLLADIEVCPVQLPGRENRLREAPLTSLTLLVARLADVLLPWLDRPFAFFGHSMGALIAFELARALREAHGLSPAHLFVAGCRAPHLPDPDPPIHALPEPEFVEELRRMQGTPDEVLDHPELRQLIIPLMRADMALVETYTYRAGDPLDGPLTAFGGADDPQAPPETIAAWREHTRGRFQSRIVPGDHFFVRTARPTLLHAISMDLGRSPT